jgi:Glycosyltransferase family 87
MADPQSDRQPVTGFSSNDNRTVQGVLPASPTLAWAIIAIVACMAALSLYVGVREALVTGIDFQWSGAHLVGEHIDPWKTMINGDPNHLIRPGQTPNYLQELYVILLPEGYLPLPKALAVWCGVNLLLLSATLWLVIRMFGLNRMHSILLFLLTLSSTPFRMTMSNGQHGIFILFLMTLVFYLRAPTARGFFLGVSYCKYSFSPLLVFFLILKRRFVMLAMSAIAPAIGLLVVWRMLGGNLHTLALEPFRLSRYGVGLGYADIMTPIEMTLRNAGYSAQLAYLIPTIVGMLAAVVAAVVLSRTQRLSEKAQFAVILLLTLFCFKHLLYDFVVMLVPLAIVLIAGKSAARTVALIGILYFWFGSTIVNRLESELHVITVVCNGILLLVTTMAVAKTAAETVRYSAEPI